MRGSRAAVVRIVRKCGFASATAWLSIRHLSKLERRPGRHPNWASNTTLDVQSDFYVANRGDNTIVRMQQDGAVVAVRQVRLAGGRPLGALQLNGIATSPDGTKIWVTLSGPVPGIGNLEAAVLELHAF